MYIRDKLHFSDGRLTVKTFMLMSVIFSGFPKKICFRVY